MDELLSRETVVVEGSRHNIVFSRDCILPNHFARIQVQTLSHEALGDQWLACFSSSHAGDKMVFEGPYAKSLRWSM